MRKIVIGIIGLSLLIAGAMFVFGQTAAPGGEKFDGHDKKFRGPRHGGPDGPGGGPGSFGPGFRELGLTDAQKAQVKEIMDANREKTAPLMDALKDSHKKMEELTANGAFDEAAVTALANEEAATMAKLSVERERVKAQVYAILTDEQKAKMAEQKAKRAEHFKNFKGPRGEKPEKVN